MGKKRTRTKKTSKGLRPSITNSTIQAVRAARSVVDIAQAKITAWRQGKNPWITIENPNKHETNRLFYRIKANAYFGGTYKDINNRVKRDNSADAAV